MHNVFHYIFLNPLKLINPNLKVGSHLAAPLEDVFDHVLALGPHLVALLHEELVEAHPVDPVGAEGRGHQEEVHAVDEVVHNDPVEPVGVPLEAPVDGVAAASSPVISRGGTLSLQGEV